MARRINLNKLARAVTLLEGKEQSQTIAQVKETIARTMDLLAIDYRLFVRFARSRRHRIETIKPKEVIAAQKARGMAKL